MRQSFLVFLISAQPSAFSRNAAHYTSVHSHRYYGFHHRFWGFLTGDRERRARGLAMKEEADRHRRKERRRRLRWLRQEGQAIRLGAATLMRGPKHHHRSSRHRHHSSHRHRDAPAVIVSSTAAPVESAYQNGQPVQVARSMGAPTVHHRHRSMNGSAVPIPHSVSRHTEAAIPISHSRSHSRHRNISQGEIPVTPSAHTGIPITPTVHSHYTNGGVIGVPRSSAGHSARQFYENPGPSRTGTARTASSRYHSSSNNSHYGRHRTHTSHTPSEIRIAA